MITDVTAIGFANNRIRSTANLLDQLYYVSKALTDDWNGQNMAARLQPGDNTILDDGSATDGRNSISADDCYGIVIRAQEFIDGLEADNKSKLVSISKVAAPVAGSPLRLR